MGGGRIITLRSLCDSFPSPYRDNMFREREIRLRAERADLEDTIESLRAQDERSNERIADLEKAIQELRIQLVTSQQERAHVNEIIGNSNSKTTHLEKTIRELRTELSDFQQRANGLLHAHEQKHQCETLYAAGHVHDAAQTLLEITNTMTSEVRANRLIMDWLAEFTTGCISTLETTGDRRSNAEKHEEALTSYSTALSLTPSNPNTLLLKWASQVLIRGSANEALCAAYKVCFA
ncbi:hypothetical protein JVT61DRAFT_10934 [Boletus reticuloceps]|uniref:Uncharacterized protein n=1 Tax=Boletus reticuloceps TaxID=495285 RepID=A0A8I3A5W5_9AGAM|nr:hypothetical protein JVT61DRAFT_10934 [Boletus reticuloceps]